MTQERTDIAHSGSADRVGWLAASLLGTAFALRVFERFLGNPRMPIADGLTVAFLLFLWAARWIATAGGALRHAYFAVQSGLVLALTALPPHTDVVLPLLVPLGLQAALVFDRRSLMAWVAGLVVFATLPFMILEGWIIGLAIGVVPAVGCVIFPAYVIAHREVEAARAQSQAVLEDLQAAQVRLGEYAAQADELSALEERNRLAHDLHDSVSQTVFGLALQARAARAYLDRDPSRLAPQLWLLQSLAEDALARIRAMIEHLQTAEPPP